MASELAGLAAAALLVLAAPSPVQAQAMVQGPARVVDGDTLVIRDERIRLFGVDAPEAKQTCRCGNACLAG